MSVRTSPKTALLGLVAAFVVVTVNYAADPGTAESAEVRANTTTLATDQSNAVVARDALGNYVVVWAGIGTQAGQIDSDGGIFFQRYDYNGVVQGAETLVNSTTSGVQQNPTVAMDASGNIIVAWESIQAETPATTPATSGIFVRRFNNTGAAIDAAELQVNTTTTSDQTRPAMGMSATGAFVIAWQSLSQDGSGQGVYARKYSSGAAGSAEFQVNVTTALSQSDPAVAVQPNGNFLIGWTSNQEGGTDGNGVYLSSYNASGALVFAERHVNTTITGQQVAPSVAVDANGNAVVAWESTQTETPAGTGTSVWGQRYDVAGGKQGTEFQVNQGTTGDQKAPSVAMDVYGRYGVAWQSAQSGDIDIYARRYNADGTADALNPGEARVNGTTTNSQQRPSVASDADGDYVIAWDSDQDTATNGLDVYARRYNGQESVDMSLVKTDSMDPVASGGALSYTFTITNNHAAASPTGIAAVDSAVGAATGYVGATPATTGIRVSDPLPSGMTYVSTTAATGWACSSATGTVTCDYANALLPGASSAVTINVTAPVTAGSQLLSNTATVTAAQYDAAAANNGGQQDTYDCANAAPTVLQFSAATYTVPEAGASATITVNRTGGNCAPATVNYATGNGTATAAADYTATSGTLSFAPTDTTKTFTVAILEDALNEANETINLTLSAPDRATLGPQSTATLTITDNDALPTVSLSPATVAIAETGGSTVVTATLSAPSGQTVTVPLAFNASSGTAKRDATCGTAQSPADFTCSTTSISIPAGSTTGTVTVTAIADTRDETNETAVVTMGTLVNATAGAGTTSTITITDDDAVPTVSFTAGSTTATESIGTLNLTVNLSAASGQVVTVPLTTSGTATAGGTDYNCDDDSATAGNQCGGTSIVFAADGAASKTITVTVANDTLDEDADGTTSPLPQETAIFTLGTPIGGTATLGATPQHTLTISDNDATPTVTLATTPATFAENGGTTVVTATLSAASGLPVTVNLAYGGTAKYNGTCGTAQTPADYSCTPSAGGTAASILIPAGSTTGTMTITGLADTLDEANETVVVDIASATNALESGTQSVSASITDDPGDVAPTVTLSLSGSPFAENGGVATVTATLNAPSGQDVTVSLAYTGSALNTTDYIRSSSSIVIPGDGVTTTGTVTLTGVDDPNFEPNETVIVDMTCNATCTESGTQQVTGVITDDDAVPQVSFASASSMPDESGALGTPGQQQLVVQLSRASSDDVTVLFSTGPGTADAADFTLASSPLVIPAGTTSGVIVVNINDDANDENDQTVIVNLQTPINATLGSLTTHTVTILDNDAPPAVNFSPATQAVGEGDAGNTAVSVSASPAVTSEKTITVPFTIGGSATGGGVDHDAVDGSLTISPNATSGNAAFSVSGDTLDEDDETVTFLMGIPANASAGAANLATVTITDDDASPTATLGLTGSPLAENGGAGTLTATLSTVSGRDVVIALAYSGTASASDYSAASSITVLAGALSGNTAITAVDDNLDEPAETVVVDMSCGASCIESGTQQVTATITDDDAVPQVKFSAATQSVTEGSGAGTTTVTVTASMVGLSGQTVTVPFTLGGGTATSADDNAANGFIVIAPGAASGSYSFTVTRDTLDEVDETIVFAMGTPTNATATAPTAQTVTILDDDAAPTVNFSPASGTATEGNSGNTAVTVTATLSTVSSKVVTVPFTVSGTATAGADHNALPGNIVINAGSTSGTYSFNVIGDTTDESNETVVLSMGGPTNATAGSATTYTETITDDDEPPPSGGGGGSFDLMGLLLLIPAWMRRRRALRA